MLRRSCDAEYRVLRFHVSPTALGEKCYLYAKHSGMVRESKAKIREELDKFEIAKSNQA